MTSLNGVILAVTATISLAMANHCDVTDTLNNQWVNVDQMKNDHDPRYLSETQVSSQEDCQKACCLIDACTVVIYDAKINQSSTNCVLLACSPDQKCVFEDKDAKVAYIIDKKHGDTAQNERTAAKTTVTPLPSAADKQESAALPTPSAVASQTTATTITTTVAQNAPSTLLGTLPPSLTNASSTVASSSSNGNKTSTITTPSLSLSLSLTTTKSSPSNSTAQKSLTPSMDTGSVQEQNASNINLQNQTTSVNVDDPNNPSNASNTEDTGQETNSTMSKLLSEEDINRLLNITEPSIKVIDLQIKPPPTTTQPFVSLLSSSTLSKLLSSSTTPTPSSSSSSSSSSTLSSSVAKVSLPTPSSSPSSSKTPPPPPQSSSSSSSSSSSPQPPPPPITSSSSSSTMATTSSINQATTISNLSTNPSGLHLMNTSTDVTNMNSNNTDPHNITEGATKNVTSSRLDNVADQTAPSSAMFGGLIALVCFGFFFVLAIVAIFGKKLFESWQRRHYSRIDYLVNGMYN